MVKFANITVTLLDGVIVCYRDYTFRDIAKKCLEHPMANSHPLMINIDNKTKLYVEIIHFKNWIEYQIEFSELIELCEVDNLARNILPIKTKYFTIDDGSLFKVKGNSCILVDDDIYLSILFDKHHFKIID